MAILAISINRCAVLEGEREGWGVKWKTLRLRFRAGPSPGGQLRACLLAVAHAIVSAEGDLLAVGQQSLFTALHHILLVEGPGIHKVL